MHKIVLLLCLTSLAYGQISLNGACDLKWQLPINFTSLAGEWYQYKRINETGSVDGNCLHLNFLIKSETGDASFVTTSVSNKKKISRNATIATNDKGFLSITYSDGIAYEMVVQQTDYKNYAILHGCTQNNSTKSVYGQVYTRAAVIPEATKTIVEAALQADTDFARATWYESSHSSEACETGSGINLQVSSLLLLLAGLVLAKDM